MGIWRRIPGSAPWGSGRIHPDPHARSDGHEALPSSTSAHRGPVPEVEVGRPVKWSIVRLMPKKSMTRSKARTGRTRAAGMKRDRRGRISRSEEHTSELQSRGHLVCRLLLEKKNNKQKKY